MDLDISLGYMQGELDILDQLCILVVQLKK